MTIARSFIVGLRFITGLWCSAGLVAQVQMQVFAHTTGLRVVDQSIPPGTDITGGASLYWSNGNPVWWADGSTQVTVSGNSVVFDNQVDSLWGGTPVIGPHAIRVHLSSPFATEVVVHAEGHAFASSIFRVDFGNDGSIELSERIASAYTPGQFEQTVTVTSAGFDVVISATADAGISPRSSSSARLTFAPATSHLNRSGTPCGAELAGWYHADPQLVTYTHSFGFQVTNAPPTQLAFLVFGASVQNIVIPPLGCVLRTDLLIPILLPTDGLGRASYAVQVPAAVTTFNLRAQFLAATLDAGGNPIWRTSEAVQLHL